MTIYIDVSSAVHAKAGIGRYAGSLARALIARQPDRFSLFYNRTAGTLPPEGLESIPARTVRAGYKPWRMAVWMGQLAGIGFNRLLPGVELFHATEHLLPSLHDVPTVLTVHDMIFKLFPEHQKRLNYWYLSGIITGYHLNRRQSAAPHVDIPTSASRPSEKRVHRPFVENSHVESLPGDRQASADRK